MGIIVTGFSVNLEAVEAKMGLDPRRPARESRKEPNAEFGRQNGRSGANRASENRSLNQAKPQITQKGETSQISREMANLLKKKKLAPINRDMFKFQKKFKKLKIFSKQLSLEKNTHEPQSNSAQSNQLR